MKIKLFLTILLFSVSCFMFADIRLPRIFGDNMVLQRNIEIPVWGWAKPGEKVTVFFKDQIVKTKTAEDGSWQIRLSAEQAGGPFTMKVRGQSEVNINNIMIGDVWICSGQSNMEWPLWNTINGAQAVKTAGNNNIRLVQVPHVVSVSPATDIAGDGWVVSSPQTAHDFSAVGFYFGTFLQDKLKVPIGLISTNWGGTRIEPWISPETCETNSNLKEWFTKIKDVDIETLKAQENEKIKKYNEAINIALGKNGTPNPYTTPSYDDSKWGTIRLPGLWEDSEIGIFDGVVWFRKSFILPENFNLGQARLKIGKIDDSDITWLNGTEVGETYMQYQRLRDYNIPDNVLKPGKNSIVVRVEDYIGAGGIYGKEPEMVISDGKNDISLAGDWKYMKEDLVLPRNPRNPGANILGPNDYPCILYNAMINPLVPFGIKGVIWYQGESNAGSIAEALEYVELFPAMIRDWRNKWKQEGAFTFLFVQLANYMEPDKEPRDEPWAYLRESQSKTCEIVPKTGMACIIDIGDANDIHPRDKKDVGYRLSLAALKKAYNQDIVYSGPTFETVSHGGNTAEVTFTDVGSGLKVKNKYGYVNGFAVAGADKKFYFARASITGDNKITIFAPPEVDNIIAVRYGWANNPDDLNLYNNENLPAVPFRTDDW